MFSHQFIEHCIEAASLMPMGELEESIALATLDIVSHPKKSIRESAKFALPILISVRQKRVERQAKAQCN